MYSALCHAWGLSIASVFCTFYPWSFFFFYFTIILDASFWNLFPMRMEIIQMLLIDHASDQYLLGFMSWMSASAPSRIFMIVHRAWPQWFGFGILILLMNIAHIHIHTHEEDAINSPANIYISLDHTNTHMHTHTLTHTRIHGTHTHCVT